MRLFKGTVSKATSGSPLRRRSTAVPRRANHLPRLRNRPPCRSQAVCVQSATQAQLLCSDCLCLIPDLCRLNTLKNLRCERYAASTIGSPLRSRSSLEARERSHNTPLLRNLVAQAARYFNGMGNIPGRSFRRCVDMLMACTLFRHHPEARKRNRTALPCTRPITEWNPLQDPYRVHNRGPSTWSTLPGTGV
jgi:hypothetical protein